MRVSLFYNEGAGEGVSNKELKGQLERGGHEVVRAVTRKAYSDLLAPPADLVVAAGGDGTIAEAAKAMAGGGIPLAIVPLGTANNIARSLGICGALPELIESWQNAVPMPFDLGAASQHDRPFTFVEGVGGGLIPAGIAAATQAPESDHTDIAARVRADLRHYYDALLAMTPCRFALGVDGTDMSGEYLVVEILNIASVGPNIVFAPGVSPSDGFFSVVTAGEEHRSALMSYLENRMEGRPAPLALPSRLAKTVEIEGGGIMHLDDESHRASEAGRLALHIQPAALHILTTRVV